MTNKLLLTVLSITLILSCKDSKVDVSTSYYSNVECIEYDFDDSPDVILDTIVDRYWAVPLETNDQNLIGRIDKMLFRDSLIIIADYSIAKSVFIFNNSGKYLSKIHRLGNGRGEYLSMRDVCLTKDGNLSILDNYKNKIVTYSLNGKFISDKTIDFKFRDFEYINEDTLAYNVSMCIINKKKIINQSECVVGDINSNLAYAFGNDYSYKNDNPNSNATKSQELYYFNGDVYCTPNSDNYIYQLTTNGPVAKYLLKTKPESLLSFADLINSSKTKRADELYSSNTFFNSDFLELKDMSLIRFLDKGYPTPIIIYNHRDKIAYNVANYSQNPIFSLFSSFPQGVFDDKTVVFTKTASYLKSIEQEGIITPKAIHDYIFSSISVDSNPVLFFFKFRDDDNK